MNRKLQIIIMYKFTLYNIYTLIRGKNTNIQVVVLGKSHGLGAYYVRWGYIGVLT